MSSSCLDVVEKTGLSRIELKLKYLQTLAAKADDHAAYLEAAGKVLDLLPEIIGALGEARERLSMRDAVVIAGHQQTKGYGAAVQP